MGTASVALVCICGNAQAGDPPPVVVDSIEPAEIVQGQVPQPTLQVFGSDFIEGLPSETNRPTVTLRQPGKGGAEFSALAWVNFAGTVATLPADLINLLQAPLGVYDVIVTRPTDGASDTLEGAFTVTDGEPDPGEIALVVRSAWGGPVNDVEVVGNLAYAAIGRRLVILDVSDATNPVEVGSLNIMPGVEGVAVRDSYAFLAAHKPYKFCVADVSDPTNPVLVSAGAGEPFSHDVELYGDFAYVRATTGQLIVIDVTDPQSVVLPPHNLPSGDVAAISIVGDLLYVGTSPICCEADLRIYDLASDPMNPVLLGSLADVGKQTTGLAVEGDYAYWTVRHEGEPDTSSLQVVNVSDPLAPFIAGSYDNGSVIEHILWDVAFSGGYAYVADATDSYVGTPAKWSFAEGLVVLDIATDPANPTVVGTFKTHASVQGVEVVGNRAYLHDAGEGLILLDVSDPTNPVRLGNYHSPATLRQMEKVGDLLFIADAWNGFTVLNVADTAHPEVVSVYFAEHEDDLGLNASGLVFQDDRVYLSTGHLGLEVIDVSNPAEPVFLGAFRIPSNPACTTYRPVALSGDVAHIGWYLTDCGGQPQWVFVNLDVSDPAGIFELGDLDPINSGGPPRQIAVNEQGIAFIGPNANELTIDTSDPENPFVVQFGDIESVVGVALEGDTRLYLASDETTLEGVSGLYIQDVTDPANPVLLAHVDENYPLGNGVELNLAYSIAVQDERAYVIGRGCSPPGDTCGIQVAYVLDVSSRIAPALLDTVPYVGGTESAIYVDEPFVYATNEFEGPNDPAIGLMVMEVVGLNPVGDLDGDGSVGASDLLILLVSWGSCPPKGDCPADLNDDGSVGAADLLILLVNWG